MTEDDFWDALEKEPENRDLMQIFADWLEERGREKESEFWRVLSRKVYVPEKAFSNWWGWHTMTAAWKGWEIQSFWVPPWVFNRLPPQEGFPPHYPRTLSLWYTSYKRAMTALYQATVGLL